MKQIFGFVVLWVLLITCVPLTNQQAASTPYGSLPQTATNVTSLISVDITSIQPLFNAQVNFINIVLISLADFRAFLQTYLVGLTIDVSRLTADWQSIANSVSGFAACIVFGFLFILFVPLVGLFMCCCRTCCDNCGGKMKQTKKRRKSKWQYCFCGSLLILTILIFAPAVIVFYANDLTTKVVNDLPDETVRILGFGLQYMDMVDEQLAFIVTQYDTFSTTVLGEVDDLRNTVGNPIQTDLRAIATPAIDKVTSLDSSTTTYTANLQVYNNSRDFDDLVEALKSDFATSFPNDAACSSSTACEQLRTEVAALNSGVDTTTDPTAALAHANTWLGSHGLYLRGYNLLFDGPLQTIIDQAFTNNGISASVQSSLNSAKATVEGQTTNSNTFTSIRTSIVNSQNSASTFLNDLKYYDYIRWSIGIALSVFLLFICVCFFVGILLGTFCGDRDELPTKRGSASNAGGILLMSGVGLIFIFSWLLMILVTLTFLVGAPVERYLCQGLQEPYDGLGLVDDFATVNLGSGINASITGLVVSCKNDTPAIDAIGLGSTFDLAAIKADVNQNFRDINYDVNVNLNTIFKLNNQQLQDAVDALGMNNILDVLSGVTATATKQDYSAVITKMNTAISDLSGNAKQSDMTNHRNTLTTLQAVNDHASWNTALQYCKVNGPLIEANRTTAVADCQAADVQIVNNLDTIINTPVQALNTTVLGHANTYLDWLILEGENNLGNCLLIYEMFNALVTISCTYIMNFWNAFWFSLGWALFFVIPCAILAMKLAKFYRRMDETDHVEPPAHLMMPLGKSSHHKCDGPTNCQKTNGNGNFNGIVFDEKQKIPRAKINKVSPEP